jgi:hypothetical protein
VGDLEDSVEFVTARAKNRIITPMDEREKTLDDMPEDALLSGLSRRELEPGTDRRTEEQVLRGLRAAQETHLVTGREQVATAASSIDTRLAKLKRKLGGKP